MSVWSKNIIEIRFMSVEEGNIKIITYCTTVFREEANAYFALPTEVHFCPQK